MKQQYIKLFSFLLGISFILSGCIYTYVNTYKQDKKEKVKHDTEIADEIGNVYKTFYDKVKNLSTYRDSLAEEMAKYTTYYSEMPDGYNEIIKKIGAYEEKVKETEDITSYLEDKCDTKYSVKEANEKCNAYYINLEKSINVFIGDVESFNSKIKEYNEWTKVENESVIATVEYKTLKEYKLEKYTDYVDLNKDGTYLGMNNG